MYIFDKQPIKEIDLPGYYEPEFDWYESSCNDALSRRTDKEIMTMVWLLDKFVVERSGEMVGYKGGELTPDLLLKKYSKEIHPSRFHFILILRIIDQRKSPETIFGNFLKDITWEETLAVALLSHIIFATQDYNDFDNSVLTGNQSGYYFDKGEYMGAYALACCEIHLALSIMPKSNGYTLARTLVKREESMRGFKSAAARWEPVTKIKEDFVGSYNANPKRYPSKAESARRFFNALQLDDQKLLGANPERNLLSYLAKHKSKP